MSEIVFRDMEKDALIDEEIVHRRNRGDTPKEIMAALHLSKAEHDIRVKRLLRRKMTRYYPMR